MFGKKKQSPAIEEAVKQSKNFEVTLIESIKKSEKRAWIVAFSAAGLSLMLAAGYMFVMPLKEKTPYLVTVDTYAGTSAISTVKGAFSAPTQSMQEAVDKSNITRFITARESYDPRILYQQDGNIVYAMAEPAVLQPFLALFKKDEPKNPDVLYGPNKIVRIKIKSIVFIGKNLVNVRFDRYVIDRARLNVETLDSNIATLEYEYQANLKMAEALQMQNPLGFRVVSYRVDLEKTNGAALNDSAVGFDVLLPRQAAPASSAQSLSPTQSTAASAAVVSPDQQGNTQ